MKDFFEQCNDLNILIIGDVILDTYWEGRVERISPEAPVPVLSFEQEQFRLGGAANVAANIQAMGATPYLVSVVGEDNYGEQFKELLIQEKMNIDGILCVKNRQTTTKIRILAKGQQLIRCDKEDIAPISTQQETQLLAHVNDLIHSDSTPIHAIIFQDYNKGVLTKRIIQEVTSWANNHGIPTTVDPKKENFWMYKEVTLFKPNLREVNENLGTVLHERHFSIQDLVDVTKRIKTRLNNENTLITLGAKGLFWSASDGHAYVPTQERSVADVCGAGDTVISVVSLALAAGCSMKEIAILANMAGGQVCESIGTVPVNKQKLYEEYSRHSVNLSKY